jgi:hypothetical protein
MKGTLKKDDAFVQQKKDDAIGHSNFVIYTCRNKYYEKESLK